MEWKLALPLHPEFRTMPMLYYVPPLMPVMGRAGEGVYGHDLDELFGRIEEARLPMKYLAALFSAGNVELVEGVMRKLLAVRIAMRAKDLDDVSQARAARALRDADLTQAQAEAIYRLTSLCDEHARYVMPPVQREEAMSEPGCRPDACKGECGLGFTRPPERGR
jgi:nitrate reductase beta subunit